MPIFLFLRELLKSMISPLPIFWVLLVTCIIFYWSGKKRLAKWIRGLSLFWFFIMSTPFLPRTLMGTLENQYPPVTSISERVEQSTNNETKIHILILGSGYQSDERLPFCGQLNTTGLARLTEGIRLHRLIPGSMLIFSSFAGSQPMPQAKVSALAAQELGIIQTDIDTICEPWNTKSEATEYFKHFGTKYKLYLVTDAAHMPRAIMHFRNTGLSPIPAPTNFNIRKNNIPNSYFDYLPSTVNIRYMEIILLEYFGMFWAKIGGN